MRLKLVGNFPIIYCFGSVCILQSFVMRYFILRRSIKLRTIGIAFTLRETVIIIIRPRYPTDPKCKSRIAFESNLYNDARTAQGWSHTSGESSHGRASNKKKKENVILHEETTI